MRWIYAGMALIAGSVLVLQISLTRVFAIMLWHHMTYMVISIALLGFGAAGSILTARRAAIDAEFPARELSRYALLYAVSVIAAFFLSTQITLDTLELWQDKWNLVALAGLYLTISVPFIFGGLAIGLALSALVQHVNRLYFFDLVGSAIGAACSVWLLGHFGSSATVMIAASLGCLAAACFGFAAPRAEREARTLGPLSLCGAAVMALLGIAMAGGAGPIPELRWHVPFAPGKEFAGVRSEQDIVRIPSSTAEVVVGPSGMMPLIMGGNAGQADKQAAVGRPVGQDGTAPTLLYQNAGDIESHTFLDDSQSSTGYVALAAAGREPEDVLVIGVGGGIDVMIALAKGASSVTAAEVNRAMVDMTTRRFDDYIGGLFTNGPHAHKVRLFHSEGRAFARSSDRLFDVIQLSGVDSYTALSTGAYTLSESYLYTVEAIKDFYSRLKPGGFINFSRVFISYPRTTRESLRLANVARTALAELGVEDPASQIAVFRGTTWGSIMIKRGAITPVELEALDDFALKEGFWGLVLDPLRREIPALHPGVVADREARAKIRSAVLQHGVLGKLQGGEAQRALSVLLAAYERGVAGEGLAIPAGTLDGLDSKRRAAATALAQNAIDEVRAHEQAFRKTRSNFEALILGSPEERAAFARDFQYDISPTRDDAPFFFNYYRYQWLWNPSEEAYLNVYWSDYPVGHLVMLASMIQIVLLAAVLILLPLRSLGRSGLRSPNRARIFGYFAGLGVGFMFIEIAVMQKMVLFLGHPTYAITVALAVLLGFAGLGSLLAARFTSVTAGVLRGLALVVTTLVLLLAVSIDPLFGAAIGFGFGAKVGICVVLLAPLGLALGMPFPLGIRLVADESPELLPWGWAINGFLSVFSSIFCIVLAMGIGFSWVLALAAAIYAGGFALLLTRPSPAVPAT